MDEQALNLLYSLPGLAIGALVSYLITRHHYLKTLRWQITPYTRLEANVFQGIDSSVRDKLKINYEQEEVSDLFLLEYIVANDGDRAIENITEPLNLILPRSVKLLYKKIEYRTPDIPKVNMEEEELDDGSTKLVISFDYINKENYFWLKLLISGKLNPKNLFFSINAPSLSDSSSLVPKPLAEAQRFPRIASLILVDGLYFLPIMGTFILVSTTLAFEVIVAISIFIFFVALGISYYLNKRSIVRSIDERFPIPLN